MKYLTVIFLFTIWMLLTFLLCCTFIGIIVVLEEFWKEIPEKLLKRIDSENF